MEYNIQDAFDEHFLDVRLLIFQVKYKTDYRCIETTTAQSTIKFVHGLPPFMVVICIHI